MRIDGMTYDPGVVDTVNRTPEPETMRYSSSEQQSAQRIVEQRLDPRQADGYAK